MVLHLFQGKSLEADIVLKCTGLTPNTSLTDKIFGNKLIYFLKILDKKEEKQDLFILYTFLQLRRLLKRMEEVV